MPSWSLAFRKKLNLMAVALERGNERNERKRLFACPPLPGLMPRSAWANDKAVCPPYRATNPPYRVDARAGLPGRELRDRLRPPGVEGGLHRGQALPAPGSAAAPRRGRRLGGEPWRLLGAQARRASRPQGHVDRLAAFANIVIAIDALQFLGERCV